MEDATSPITSLRTMEGLKGKIREALPNIKLSISPFDTAWVAMVPSQTSSTSPCFPACLEWVMENQNQDGSWSLPSNRHFLMKATLSSTMACILALKRWNVENDNLMKGIEFIQTNSSFAIDDKQYSPIGFSVIFSGMLQQAKEMGLNIPISNNILDTLMSAREKEIRSGNQSNCTGWKKYLAYAAEGLVHDYTWEDLLKYQRKNGSLFCSPSTTAAFLIHTWNADAFGYLSSLVQKFGNAVPSIYPSDTYTHLALVDSLDKLGIAHHFRDYIQKILDETYIEWQDDSEEIHSDLFICALAFRLLRVHGYDIFPPGVFTLLNEDELFNSSIPSNLREILTVLELHKASQLKISRDERYLEEVKSCCSHILKELKSNNDLDNAIIQEIDDNLKFPFYSRMDRLEHKRNIQTYSIESARCLKAPFLFQGIDNKDLLELAAEDFNICQRQFQTELQLLDRWVREARLDQLKFARQKLSYCYFSVAATTFPAEMFHARISWAKNSVLTTVIDDFFDVGGSREEMINFVDLIRRWDADYKDLCCSENVYILFSTLYTTINEFGAIASSIHGYHVTSHLIETWLELVTSMMQEAEWGRNGIVPTIAQYMTNGCTSFALGPIILPSAYFVGPKLSWDIVRSSEYNKLFKLVSTVGRLNNDIQGFEREGSEGKLNSVSLRILGGGGSLTKAEAVKEVRHIIDASRTELLGLVLQEKGSVVPRPCKDLFWKMYRILSTFYAKNDGFSSPTEMMVAVKSVLYEHVTVSCSWTSFD